MKKLIAALLVALMCLVPATAEGLIDELPELPENGARDAVSGDTIDIEIDGKTVTLDFDPSDQYSSIEDGLVQASYYKYSDDALFLYELYLIFPDFVQPGDTITPDTPNMEGLESSVVLIVSDIMNQKETYYFSSTLNHVVYPEGSDFTIALDDVYEIEGETTFVGKLSGKLIALDMASGEVESTLEVKDAAFKFSLGGNGSGGDRRPGPSATPVPDDMKKV